MNLLQTTALCLGVALAAPAAFAAPAISDVEVKVELGDYANSNALDYWPSLAEDLGKAIIERVDLTTEVKDPSITVHISKVAVDDNPVLTDDGRFNQLIGVVQVAPGETALTTEKNKLGEVELVQNYPLLMHAVAGEADAGEGWITIPPSQDDFYNAMVNAFATEIVNNLDK